MKKDYFTLIGGIFFLSLFSIDAAAQKNVNTKMNHVLADTTFLRAVEVTLEPGEKTEMHTHPANFFYAITEGKLMVHFKDGKNQPYNLKAGDAGVTGPESEHITENVGNTKIKFLVVELKEHPYKALK